MKLTTKEISFIAKDFDKKSQVSLFANVQEAVSGAEEKSLTAKGIYKDGKLTKKAREILEIVASAKKCTRLILKDSFIFIEKYTYKANNKLALVENDGGDMIFSMTDNLPKTVEQISEFTGKSIFKSSGVEILLSADELLIFLAMIDIYRRNAMLAYVGHGVEKAVVSLNEIMKQINDPSPNSLVKLFKQNYNYPIPQVENAKVILKKLTRKDFVTFNNGYELISDYAVFAKSFLVPETIIMIDTFNVNEKDEVIVAGGICITAGLRNIASFIMGNDGIDMSSLSGSQLLQMVENFLKCPDIS